jgi:hypothetical protein
MNLSFITINRILEDQAAIDEEIRRKLQRTGRVVLSDGRKLSDDALLAKLRSMDLPVDSERFLALSRTFFSAQDMAESVYKRLRQPMQPWGEDWVWIAFTCLWERWQPDRPSLEMLDDWMQLGYKAEQRGDSAEACRLWLAVWNGVCKLAESEQLHSVRAFDERFPMTQCVFNWVQDFIRELANAGRDNLTLLETRLDVLNTFLGRFQPDGLLLENCKSQMAETLFLVGKAEQGEEAFRRLLDEDPLWGYGWIHWSNCYNFIGREEDRDPVRAEQILKQGLAVVGVRDRKHMLERLVEVYEDAGRNEEARTVQAEIDRQTRPTPARAAPIRKSPQPDRPALWPGNRGTSSRPLRVGRNDPCPCGSGKKFKKCCGQAR